MDSEGGPKRNDLIKRDNPIGDWINRLPPGSVFARTLAFVRSHSGKVLLCAIAIVAIKYYSYQVSHDERASDLNGSVLVEQGRYDEAIAEYNKSITLAPNWYRPYTGRGEAYRRKGDYESALSDFDKSIELNSNYPESHYGRGLVWRDKGELTRAMTEFDEAIRLAPEGLDSGKIYIERARLFQAQNSFERALSNFDHAIARQNKPSWLLDRARLYLDLDRAGAAADDFTAAAHEAISYRDSAKMLGIDDPNSRPGQQPREMMESQVPFDPAGYYTLLWAHFARVNAGQDDSQEMIDLVKELARPIWRTLLLDVNGGGHNIDDVARARALTPWPGPVYLMFLGKITPDELQAAVNAGAGDDERKRRQCDADFYVATLRLQKQALNQARALFQAAAKDCPVDSQEAHFANGKLKKL